VLEGPPQSPDFATTATFTSDGYSVVAGCEDAKIRVWDAEKRARPAALHGHAGPVRHVACSRKYDVLASCCASAVLWLAD
jgi:WD40 repeat protein